MVYIAFIDKMYTKFSTEEELCTEPSIVVHRENAEFSEKATRKIF